MFSGPRKDVFSGDRPFFRLEPCDYLESMASRGATLQVERPGIIAIRGKKRMDRGLGPIQIPRTKPDSIPGIPRSLPTSTPTPTWNRDLCRDFAPYNQKHGLSKDYH
jgi:hypothetical protein